MKKVVVCAAKRTPFGKFGGSLVQTGAIELGALVINRVLGEVPQVETSDVDEVILGNCLPGNGLSPARQCVLAAGWPLTTNALTLDRACCSALTSIGLSYQHILGGFARIAVAGGTENMSRTPYLIPQMRWGQRLGDFTVEDDLVIRNPYVGAPMAKYVGEFALERSITRKDLDAWALRSHRRWADAQSQGKFSREVMALTVPGKAGECEFTTDECPRVNSSLERLACLRTVYGSPLITAGNASAIADGASAVMLMGDEVASERRVPVLATIVDYLMFCGEPRESAVLPGVAIGNILRRLKLPLEKVKLIEINEAFAAMPLVSSQVLGDCDADRVERIREIVNVNGGAVAIGHPLGATGARLLMTLIYELHRRGGGYGVAAICGAAGQVDVAVVEV